MARAGWPGGKAPSRDLTAGDRDAVADTIRCRKKSASPLLDGEAPAGWGITHDRTRAEDVLRPAPDVDGRMPRVSKWER
jgi:hypothetical protein